MTFTRVATGAAVLLSASALLAGCGSAASPSGGTGSTPATTATTTAGGATPLETPSAVVTFTLGVPSGVTPTQDLGEAFVVWGDPGQLEVVTYGSSTCPILPETVTYSASTGLSVKTVNSGGTRPCTMDLVPTTSTVKAPDGLADGTTAKVTIDGQASTLAAR